MVILIVEATGGDATFAVNEEATSRIDSLTSRIYRLYQIVSHFRRTSSTLMHLFGRSSSDFHDKKGPSSGSSFEPPRGDTQLLRLSTLPVQPEDRENIIAAIRCGRELVDCNENALDENMLQEQMDRIRQTFCRVFPLNEFPSDDAIRALFETERRDIDIPSPVLWLAGRKLVADEGKLFLCDYVGRNEKSKIKVTLQSASHGPPVRQRLPDEETHKNMLRFYHKRQEELKQLNQDEDDSYLSAAWTDPQSLKRALVGTAENLKWRF